MLTLLEVGDEFAGSSVVAPGHPEYWDGPFDSLFIRLSSIIMKSYFKWKSSAQLMTADVLAAIAGEKLSMVHSLGLRLPRKSAAGPVPSVGRSDRHDNGRGRR